MSRVNNPPISRVVAMLRKHVGSDNDSDGLTAAACRLDVQGAATVLRWDCYFCPVAPEAHRKLLGRRAAEVSLFDAGERLKGRCCAAVC